MGLRMRKSIKICKGVRVNFSKSGTSLSFGTKGLRQTISTSGRRTTSVGIPGTGFYYTTSSSGKKRSSSSNSYARAQAQAQRQQEKLNEIENNRRTVQNFNNLIESIKSLHKTCDEKIDWNHINSVPAPFDPMQSGPAEIAATQMYNNFKPRFYENWFPQLGEKRKQKLYDNIDIARKKDTDSYSEWESLNTLSANIINGDIESYLTVIDEMKPFDDLLDYGSDFEVGIDTPDSLCIEFHVMSDKVIPQKVMSLTQTGKLSTKDMTKTMRFDLTQDYICSCTIRIARDVFALLPVSKVVVHAVDNILNTATGFEEEATVLSVAFDKETLNSLNFNSIDPSDALENFECNMDFKKTQGLKPVERIEL